MFIACVGVFLVLLLLQHYLKIEKELYIIETAQKNIPEILFVFKR